MVTAALAEGYARRREGKAFPHSQSQRLKGRLLGRRGLQAAAVVAEDSALVGRL